MHNKLQILLICVVLVAATIIAFEPVRHNGFVAYDDDDYITDNSHVKGGLSREAVYWAFTTTHAGNWHPLTWLSHILDYELFGLDPFWHHLSGLLLHITNTLLLFWVLKEMTGCLWPSVFVAGAFALHPIHVESVVWAAERKDMLSSFFWMLTIAFYIRYTRKPNIGRYLLVVFALALGLMAKPMLVTLPFVLLLLDYWPLGRFNEQQKDTRGATRLSKLGDTCWLKVTAWHLLVEKIPLFILVVASSVVTFIIQKSAGAMTMGKQLPLSLRIGNAVVSYICYIGKLFYPRPLAVLYPYHELSIWQSITCFVIVVVASAAIIYIGRRHRYLITGWLWYLGTLVPVIGMVQVGVQSMADRYTYLPSIGIFIMVAWGASELFSRHRYQKTCLSIAAAAALAALLIVTRSQVRYWQSSLALFEHAVKVTKNNFVMYDKIGNELLEQKKIDEAIIYFDKALLINPKYYKALNNKGRAYLDMGKNEQAATIFNEVISLKKDWPDVYNYLGLSYTYKGELDRAVQYYEQALRLKPDYVKALNNLGAVLSDQGKIDQAIEKWQKALQFEPDYPNSNYSLGLAMAKKGQYEQSARYFERTLRVKPDWSDAHYNLAAVYYRLGKPELSLKHCAEAVRLKPDYLLARLSLAHTLFEMGKIEAAIGQYQKILQFEPNRVEVLNDLAWILATTEETRFRNPSQALEYAQKACELTNYKRPELMDALAAAYAAAGEFEKAIQTAGKAVELANSEGQKKLAEEIQNRLRLYKTGQPYIELSLK